MMTRTLLAATAALLALAACDRKPAPLAGSDDPTSANFAGPATPVALPPAIVSNKSYRCKDNSVVQIALFKGGLQANVTEEGKTSPTVLKATADGDPLVAEGFELSVKDGVVKLARPEHPKQVCTG